jgi:hypothetical protein
MFAWIETEATEGTKRMDLKPAPGSVLLPLKITGTQPLLLASSAGVLKQGDAGERLAELTKLRKRTEADEQEMRRLKYFFALYCDPKLGPYVPGYNLWVAVSRGAMLHKMGKNWERGGVVLTEKMVLEYDGPRDPVGLFEDPRFVDIRPARIFGRGMIEAVRPIFFQWNLKVVIAVNDAFVSLRDAKRAIEMAGLTEGLGTWRRRFGRFEVQFGESRVVQEDRAKAA